MVNFHFFGILVVNIYSDESFADIGLEFQPLDLKNLEFIEHIQISVQSKGWMWRYKQFCTGGGRL